MASNNLALLTKSHKLIAAKKRAKREQIKEVLFDDDARREFLTGFHKRKLQKSQDAKRRAQDREKLARLEIRREHRRELAQRALQNAADVEKAYGALVSDNEGPDDDAESTGEQEKTKVDEDEYSDEEHIAHVTVIEDFDFQRIKDVPSSSSHDDLPQKPPPQAKSKHSFSLTSKPPPEPKSIPKPPSQWKDASSSSSKPKKIKYESVAARKAERAKQKRRKVEKAERAGGKERHPRSTSSRGRGKTGRGKR